MQLKLGEFSATVFVMSARLSLCELCAEFSVIPHP